MNDSSRFAPRRLTLTSALIVAWVFGLVVLQFCPLLPWTSAEAAVITLCLLLATVLGWWALNARPWPSSGRLLVVLLTLTASSLTGFGYACWRADQRLAANLPVALEGHELTIVGVVSDLPQTLGSGSRQSLRFRFVLEEPADLPSEWLLTWPLPAGADQKTLAVRAGERWRLTVKPRRPYSLSNPSGFDAEAWLFERNIRVLATVRSPYPDPAVDGEDESESPAINSALNAADKSGVRLSKRANRPYAWLAGLRQALRERIEGTLSPGEHPFRAVITALVVGDQQGVVSDHWQLFNLTGVTHLFSVSGVHITMFAWLFGRLFAALWRRTRAALFWPTPYAARVAGTAAAWAYSLIAGFGVASQRTVAMLLVATLGCCLGRRLSIATILSLALLLVCLFDPWAVLAPGFWLSFAAVSALIWADHGRVEATARYSLQMISHWSRAQWAATLATLPLLLLLFGQFAWISPLANALAIPIVSIVVTPLSLLGVLLPQWPIIDLAHGLLTGLMAYLEWLARVPTLQIPSPSLLLTVVAAIGIALILAPAALPGRGLGWLLLLPLLLPVRPSLAPGSFRATVLDVGQGLAVVIETAAGVSLFDTGPRYAPDKSAAERVILPWLQARAVTTLNTLIVSHQDQDHQGGVSRLLKSVTAVQQRTGSPSFDGIPCRQGQYWLEAGVVMTVIYPTGVPIYPEKSNHRSCVLRIDGAYGRLLISADIEAEDEALLLAAAQRGEVRLDADVLVVPHHGSRTSSSAAFLAAVAATHAVIPVGYRNRYRHPHPDVVTRLSSMQIWRTDRDGAVTIDASRGLTLHANRSDQRRYWQSPWLPSSR